MITNAFLTIAIEFLDLIKGIFPPSAGFDPSIHNAFSSIGGALSAWDVIFPVSTLGVALTLVFSVEAIIWGSKAIRWAISHLPWIGGKGV